VSRLPRQLAILVPIAFIAACTTPTGAATDRPSASAPRSGGPSVATASATPTPPTAPVASGATGGTSAVRPDVSVEPLGGDTYRITVADPDAKAWRMTIQPADDSGPFLRVVVETSDVSYSIDATAVTPPADRTRVHLRRPNTAPICELTTGACLARGGVRSPGNPSRHAVSFLVTLDAAKAVAISGGIAEWSSEPFILGPWLESEALVIGG
jgi:hypothetical protein